LGEEARKLAVGSVELLENATIFPTLEAAIGDIQFVLATTARNRAANYAIYSPSNAAKRIINKAPLNQENAEKTAIIFGPEKNGLSNNLLSLCDGVININTFEGYPVLNLAQSVTLICSEVWRQKTEIKEDIRVLTSDSAGQRDQLAQNSEILFFLDRLKEGLIERGYASTAKNNNIKIEELVQDNSFLGLTRIIKRCGLTSRELLMLNGMLSALLKDK
jgi:tRNA/rRNA methyltransferase